MALVTFGNVTAKGKCGDVVYYRSRWGNVARDNFTPYQPNTTRQTNTRISFTQASNLWDGLPPGTKKLWDNTTAGLIKSPRHVFMHQTMNRVKTGLPFTPFPQQHGFISEIKILTPSIAKGTANWFVKWIHEDDAIDLKPNEYMVISTTNNRAPHARQVDPPYRITSIIPPLTVSPVDIWADYIATWAPEVPIIGMRQFVQVQLIHDNLINSGNHIYSSTLVEP